MAAMECAQAIKLITGKGSVLSGAFLWMDLREDEFSRLSLKKGVQSE
ncbi:hypothetical protein MASR2M17_26190 [Aminivibrio sp.]